MTWRTAVLYNGTVLLNEVEIDGRWDHEPGNNHSGTWTTISVERRPIYLPLIARARQEGNHGLEKCTIVL